MLDKYHFRCFFSCFRRRSFQNVLQTWWTVYNDFYPVATKVTSNLLSLAWRLRLDPIVGSNAPKPNPIYASLRRAFHPKSALSARKCIAQYRLKFQITHSQYIFWIHPWCSGVLETHRSRGKKIWWSGAQSWKFLRFAHFNT